MQQNTLGNIAYEITNYLGNVNVVISDRKIWNATPISAFKACIVSRTDYFPFEMLNDTWFSGTESLSGINPDWSFSGISGEISSRTTNSDNYRFGYNGMESDDETKGSGNSYTTEFRQYDPRIGRWLSLDPLMAQYPMMSPYVAFNNNPIYFVDPLGLEGVDPNCESVDPECDEGSEMGTNSIPPDWYRNNRTGEEQYIEDMTQESLSWGHAIFKDGKLIESSEEIWTRIDGPSQQNESISEEKKKNERQLSSSTTVLENPWNNGGLGNILNQSNSSLSYTNQKINTNIQSPKGSTDLSYLGNVIGFGGVLFSGLENTVANKYWWMDAKGNYNSTKILEKGTSGKYLKGVQGMRNGYNSSLKAASAYKVAGNVVGGFGIVVTGAQFYNNQITATEASVDVFFGVIGFFGPIGAGISATYFIGKLSYEYFSGNTVFEKPR